MRRSSIAILVVGSMAAALVGAGDVVGGSDSTGAVASRSGEAGGGSSGNQLITIERPLPDVPGLKPAKRPYSEKPQAETPPAPVVEATVQDTRPTPKLRGTGRFEDSVAPRDVNERKPDRRPEGLPSGLVPSSREQIAAARSSIPVAYQLDENPRIIVFDLPSLLEQGRSFVRIVLFIERRGAPHERILTVAETRNWLAAHGERLPMLTVGNNLRASDFTRFFNTARLQGEPLTKDERALLAGLVSWGVVADTPSGVIVTEPEKIVITVPQASSVDGCAVCVVRDRDRSAILDHELAHGRYATDSAYRDYARWFWHHVMSDSTRERFVSFLGTRGYDPEIPELMVNEMQAFLMHTTEPAMFSAEAVGISEVELSSLRQRFAAGLGASRVVQSTHDYRFD